MFHVKHPQGRIKHRRVRVRRLQSVCRKNPKDFSDSLYQQHPTVPRQRQMYRAVRD